MLKIFFIFSVAAGQIIKFPFQGYGGISLLDIFIFFTCFFLLLKTKLKLKAPPLFLYMAIFFIFTAILSLLLSPLTLTPTENLVSFSYTVRFFFYILFGWLLFSANLLRDFREPFLKIGFILAILGLAQLLILPDLRFLELLGWDPHFFRTVSTFLDPNFLGAFLVLSLISFSGRKISLLNMISFVIIFVALLTTFSRSSYLAFAVAFFSLSILIRSKKFFLLTVFLVAILFSGFSAYQQLVSKPRNINREQSAQYRINSWKQGFTIFQNNLSLGVGFNSYRFALKEYKLAPEQFISSRGASSNDSSLLFVAATTGILGLIIYLFFLLTLFLNGLKNNVFLAGLLALIAQSFFANILFYPFLLIWILLNAVWKKPE